MANDGQIVFEVTADGKHAIADIKEITRAIQNEANKWDDAAEKSTKNIDNSFSSLLKKLAAGFSAVKIGQSLLDIGKSAISAASDLEEVQNVVDVTFGADSNKIEQWAKNAGDQFGLTETQAKRFTSTLGAMMKSAGLSGSQITDISTDLAGLAADMASFYNLDFDTAFQKIRSGLSGETEPLKQLGINMSVANLNAYALQQGLEKTFEQMDQGEQTMLRYQYIMQATSDAQGDFARTSDGYANSMRNLETNIETLKTKLGQTLIPAVSQAVGWLNQFLGMLAPDDSGSILDQFTDIDNDVAAKIAQIESVKREAEDLGKVLDQIFGRTDRPGDTQGIEAAEIMAKYGVKSDMASKYLASLGFTTEEVDAKQRDWLETCKRLVNTIPGLNEIINTETGEVKGGRKAIDDYVQAWADGQKKLALMNAQARRRQALEETYAELPGLEVNKMLWEDRAKRAREQLDGLIKKYGLDGSFTADTITPFEAGSAYAEQLGLTNEQATALSNEIKYYRNVKISAKEAADAFNDTNREYEEAVRVIEEGDRVIEQLPGDIDNVTDATEEWLNTVGKSSDEITDLVNNAKTALQELDDYVSGVRESVEKSVDSAVKGFEKISTPMMDARQKTKDLTDKLTALGSRTSKNADEWDKLNEEINQYNSKKISAQGIGENLEQQAQYMEDYLKYLNQARERGISDEVLAQLSDGSEESYDVLEALANASAPEVDRINNAYQSVIDKKKEMTDELSKQQLTVDKTYESLADKARQAVAELDLEGEAAENSGKTIKGIADGIAAHVPDVQTAVDAIMSQLDRLNGFGVDIDLGGFGHIQFTTSTGATEGSARMGLDYVPHDDYIARLHEGEKVLSAQEASIYRGLANGSLAGVDLDSLGGVMRDNIRPGGNVYLDGRIVGAVVSEQQGRSYKSMKRSGWQQ